jgi:hypothetical protein
LRVAFGANADDDDDDDESRWQEQHQPREKEDMENSPQREGGSRPIKTCKSLLNLSLSLSLAGNARKEGVFVVIKATRAWGNL